MPGVKTLGTCRRKCQREKVRATRPPIVEPMSLSHAMVAPDIGLLRIVYFPGPMGLRFAKDLDTAITPWANNQIMRVVLEENE